MIADAKIDASAEVSAGRRRVFAANWKMNHGPTAARAFMREFSSRYAASEHREVAFFPPALSLAAAMQAAGANAPFRFGVQHIYSADSGAFTGENSAPIARDAGASLALVGHSERRHVFGQTDAQIAAESAAAARAGLTPLLCVGETLAQREEGATEAIIVAQLLAGLSQLDAADAAGTLIAYEPVWAIGTGRNASPADAGQIHTVIREALRGRLNTAADGMSILYGGSVTPANVAELLAAPNVDGVLVGGASLAVDSWLSICGCTIRL